MKVIKNCAIFPVLAIIFVISACAGDVTRTFSVADNPNLTINVTVTFEAMREIASAIGGDRISISKIIPPGAGAHHFEPTARDLIGLNRADVFIKSGFDFEPWAGSAVNAAGRDNLIIVNASKHVEPIFLTDGGCAGDAARDPHTWLSLKNAVIMATAVRDAFIEADPDGAEYYRDNFDTFAQSANALFNKYYARFDTLTNRTIVVSHAVFGYLVRDFNLYQKSIQGVFAEGEPSARALTKLIEFSRERNISTIFKEYTGNHHVAKTLANELGAAVKVIYTIESPEKGLSYFERMERNLNVIYNSLSYNT